MKILYTGPFRPGSLTEARRKALYDLGHDVVELDQTQFFDRGHPLIAKAQVHALIGPNVTAYNRALLALAEESKPDLIYIDQGSYLGRNTVLGLRATGARLVHYTSEWFGFRRYWYRHFFKSVELYDVHVLTFPTSKAWLEREGARKVVMTEFGFDPHLHRVPELTDSERAELAADAIFIGHHEPYSERMVAALRHAGVKVDVFGPGWSRARSLADRDRIGPVYGQDYVKRLAAARVCLGFMSKVNHNTYSGSRTFEIPAVGGFLLTERTEPHQRYFVEGKEAEFYDSTEELVAKTRYYLANEERRAAVARRGQRRCIESGYSHTDRMKRVLEMVS